MTGEHCTEFYFPKGANCDPCKNRDNKIKELELKLTNIQELLPFFIDHGNVLDTEFGGRDFNYDENVSKLKKNLR